MAKWQVLFTVEADSITDALLAVLFPNGEPVNVAADSVRVTKVP